MRLAIACALVGVFGGVEMTSVGGFSCNSDADCGANLSCDPVRSRCVPVIRTDATVLADCRQDNQSCAEGFRCVDQAGVWAAWRTMEAARQVTVMMVLSVVMRVASTVAGPVLHAQQAHPVTEVRIVCLRFVKVAFA